MTRYTYAYRIEEIEGEAFYEFPAFPEIISAVPLDIHGGWDAATRHAHAEDAVVTALQTVIAAQDDVPPPDSNLTIASGYVQLSSIQAMKLELYRVFKANELSIAEFARRIHKKDTTARRLLNLSHRSTASEIDEALAALGKVLVHDFHVEPSRVLADAILQPATD